MNEFETAARQFGILDQAPMGMCVIRADCIVLFWNSCLEDWTGIKRQDIVSSDIGSHFAHLTSAQYRSRLETIFRGGPPAIFSSQLHGHLIPSRLPTGQLRIQHTIATAVPTFDGAGFYALFAVQDVTELTHRINEYRRMRDQAREEIRQRVLAEEELKQANAMILEQQKALIEEERLKVLLQMAGTTAHELNQPLMGLLGNIELMKMAKDDPERLAKRLEGIEQCGRRISEIVKRMQSIRHYATKPYVGKDAIINLDQEVRLLAVVGQGSEYQSIPALLSGSSRFNTSLEFDIHEAFKRLEEGRFDLIMLMHDLPDLECFEFLEKIKREKLETPVLVLTGNSEEHIIARVVAAGAFDCLPVSKVNNKTLFHLVVSTLERARIRSELEEAHRKMAAVVP